MEKARILIVEDNKIIALEIKERIGELGYDVIAMVKSGEEAIEITKKEKPDLILMDIKLDTEMDGIETVGRIRYYSDCPVIYLTAYTDEETIQRAKLTEPYGYIVKPLDERQIKSVIEIALYRHSMGKKLKDSEARYRSIVDTLEGLLFIADEKRRIIFKNKQMEEFIETNGYDKKHCYEMLFKRNEPCAHCTMDKILQGEVTKTEIKDEIRDKWFYLINSPVYSSDGRVLNQHLMIDITDRKKNEHKLISMLNEKEVLLREVHHRVKNNMQLMLSLIRLQASKSKDKNVKYNLKSFENRIASMSLIHENLYSSDNLYNISFNQYISRLVLQLVQAYSMDVNRININLDIDKLSVPIDTAIPCGMIINELVTNAFKYAFPGNLRGVIDISFKKENNVYLLYVKDDGIGLDENFDINHNNTLGMQIINTLSRQLQTKPDIKNNNGVEFKLVIDEDLPKECIRKTELTEV